jgi:hypothetical protein
MQPRPLPSTKPAHVSGLADKRTRSSSEVRSSRCLGTSRHTEVELLPVHLREEAYSPLRFTMLKRWRTAGRVLPGTCRRSSPKTCPGSYGIFTPVLKLWLSLLERQSLILLRSRSLSLKAPSSSLLDGSLPCDARALACLALACWGWVRIASLRIRPAFAAVGTAVLPEESQDRVCRLKPLTRNECCSIGLMVKSSIFLIWPMLAMSRLTWPHFRELQIHLTVDFGRGNRRDCKSRGRTPSNVLLPALRP